MRQFIFYLNLLLTIAAFIITLSKNIFNYDQDSDIGFLLILGFFQVSVSFMFTIYAIAKNKYLLVLYILYWFFVALFFKFFINDFIYMCLLIALYNLYINYCSFSNSKFNIIKL